MPSREGNGKAGKGRLEIIGVEPSTVHIDLQFLKPVKSHSNMVFEVQPDGDGTLVSCGETRIAPPESAVEGMADISHQEGQRALWQEAGTEQHLRASLDLARTQTQLCGSE